MEKGLFIELKKIKRDNELGFLKTKGNIVAIDFGTTFCVLAFMIRGDTYVNTLKVNDRHQRVLLLHKGANRCQVVPFGYRAEDIFPKIRPSECIHHIYFKRINIFEKDEVSYNDNYN